MTLGLQPVNERQVISGSKIFTAVYSRVCSTGPLTSFSKTTGIAADSCENSTAAEMGFNSYPNIKQKWNWFQIFQSEIYESPKNGSRGALFPVSYRAIVLWIGGQNISDASSWCFSTFLHETEDDDLSKRHCCTAVFLMLGQLQVLVNFQCFGITPFDRLWYQFCPS